MGDGVLLPNGKVAMSEKGKGQNRASRAGRRADALRENLRRRKLQARTRGAASGEAESGMANSGRPGEQPGQDSGKR